MNDNVPAIDEHSLAAWVARWQANGPVLQRLDRERAEQVSLSLAIELLDDAFEAALRRHPPARSSGLVTQQSILRGCSA